MTGQAKDESVIELGDSVPAPLGFNAFGPECLFYAGKHWSGGQGSAGMRPERRLQRRNGGAAHSPPQNETQKTPPDISLLRAKNGLDNGVHLIAVTTGSASDVFGCMDRPVRTKPFIIVWVLTVKSLDQRYGCPRLPATK